MSPYLVFFFSSRRRHTRFKCDWSSDVCSSDLAPPSAESCCSETSPATSLSPSPPTTCRPAVRSKEAGAPHTSRSRTSTWWRPPLRDPPLHISPTLLRTNSLTSDAGCSNCRPASIPRTTRTPIPYLPTSCFIGRSFSNPCHLLSAALTTLPQAPATSSPFSVLKKMATAQ